MLLGLWAAVVGAGLTAELLRYLLGAESWVSAFSLSYEQNVPTWYSSCLLFTCATLLSLIAVGQSQTRAGFVAHWWGLAALFFYISMDETVSLHEHMNEWFDTRGVLYFGWIIPASAILLVLGACFWKFLRGLPPSSRRRFILAGVVYVSGGLATELPLGYWVETSGSDDNLGYALIDSLGESLELLGTTLFLLALVRHLSDGNPKPGHNRS